MKTAIVTGANSGMGKATVAALSDFGIKVVMLCRDEARGNEAYNDLMKTPGRNIELMFCDLGDMESIRNFSKEFHDKHDGLDVLVNNAGFISLKREETFDGLERTIGINHFGHFLLTILLVDLMKSGGRIVNVSSGAHKIGKINFKDINLEKGYNVIKAYSQSKLANVLFTKELARRLKDQKISVNCCHPGAVATNMGVNRNTGFGKTIYKLVGPFFLTPEQGAYTAIYLATSDHVKGKTGKYFYKCKQISSSKSSRSKLLAQKFFDISEEITGCRLEFQNKEMSNGSH